MLNIIFPEIDGRQRPFRSKVKEVIGYFQHVGLRDFQHLEVFQFLQLGPLPVAGVSAVLYLKGRKSVLKAFEGIFAVTQRQDAGVGNGQGLEMRIPL
ncbi:hypothetical protein AVEN_168817-1 [Araneus ventricosus]|uniref:Uncharacterized protein n=1 Tax=Araneus ventricosus TaxID=182803 RepID=A0A4Y2P6U8_ARAVE|nr:hypothetical protein AVEN_168817-1 [Araneus ventricosus]